MLELLQNLLAAAYVALLVPLALLGLHRAVLVLMSLRRLPPASTSLPQELPAITVQLPLFNERCVAARLLAAVSRLDWPPERLQIQVLDDSTDDTSEIVRSQLAGLQDGPCVEHLRRHERRGFKAGALAAGLASATGEFIAVFDADFVPEPDFLRRVMPPFADPRIGAVQARWEHLNAEGGPLPAAQAGLLDAHFAVEHAARAANGLFFNFNGTAGVLRRACIEDAGGWQHDTLTEDLDLSYRAQLRGWQFVFLPDVSSPAELPPDMAAFLNQQRRWAQGAVQTGVKLGRRILAAPIGLHRRLEAAAHLFGSAAFPLLLLLILVGLPLQVLRATTGDEPVRWLHRFEALPLGLATLCVLGYYGAAQIRLRRAPALWLRALLAFVLGAGLTVNQSLAVWAGLRRPGGEFLRTPKQAAVGRAVPGPRYVARRGSLPWCELLLGAWAATTASISLVSGQMATAAFHALFALGLLWAGGSSLRPRFAARERPTPLPTPA